MIIERHPIDRLEKVQEQFDYSCRRLTKVIGYCRNRSASVAAVVDAACDVVLNGSAVQLDSPEISRAIRVGAQAGVALYQILGAGDEPMEFQLGDGPPLTKKGAH